MDTGGRINEAYREWFKRAVDVSIKVIREDFLSGPWPKKLGEQTGALKGSLNGGVLPDGYYVRTNKKYGAYWEFGIPARTIVAKPGSVLALRILRPTRMTLFRKRVFVPKQEPRRWLEPGFRASMPQVMELGSNIMNTALKVLFPDKSVYMEVPK